MFVFVGREEYSKTRATHATVCWTFVKCLIQCAMHAVFVAETRDWLLAADWSICRRCDNIGVVTSGRCFARTFDVFGGLNSLFWTSHITTVKWDDKMRFLYSTEIFDHSSVRAAFRSVALLIRRFRIAKYRKCQRFSIALMSGNGQVYRNHSLTTWAVCLRTFLAGRSRHLRLVLDVCLNHDDIVLISGLRSFSLTFIRRLLLLQHFYIY